MDAIVIEHEGVRLELIGRTVRAANMSGTLRYFLDVDADPDMPFEERIARGTFAALIAHTRAATGLPDGVQEAYNMARVIRDKTDAERAYSAFSDAIDPYVDLYNLWYAVVNQARQPVGDEALQPPTPDNADVRKKKTRKNSAAS